MMNMGEVQSVKTYESDTLAKQPSMGVIEKLLLETLENTKDLHQRITDLTSRINPVLQPEGAEAITSNNVDPKPMPQSDVAKMINEINDTVEGANRRIAHLRSRVDL